MICFGTATLQRCNSECRAELAPAMPSASSLDEVNAAAARAERSSLQLCRAPAASTKSTLQQREQRFGQALDVKRLAGV